MMKNTIIKHLLSSALLLPSFFGFSQSGVIKGQIVDKETRDPLFGAYAILNGTTTGAVTDMDGNFSIISVPPGRYNINGSYISYETFTTEEVVVRSGDTLQINMELSSRYHTLDEVVIVAKSNLETETALLLDRRKAVLSRQSIGAAELSRKGIGDAQIAVSTVSGISRQEGVKNIFVRGLGDRYNITLLNGLPVPSEDPEYKNIALSVFKSDMIKNISVDKVFSARYSGDAGGAVINIDSKELTTDQAVEFQISGGFNTNISPGVFKRPRGANYFGFSNVSQPKAGEFDFVNSLDPFSTSRPSDQSFRISGGKRFQLADNPLSLNIVASHSAKNLFTEEIVRNTTSNGTIYQDQRGKKYGNNSNQIVLANINYDIHRSHSVAYNFAMLHSSHQYVGDYPGLHSEKFQDGFNGQGFIRRQQINDNLLFIHQIVSRWKLHDKIEAKACFSGNAIKGLEPDRRENYFSQKENGMYGLTGSNRQKRFFSELKERDYNMKFVLSYSLNNPNKSGNSNISLGYHGRISNNDFEAVEYNFSHIPGSISIEDLVLDDFYNSVNFHDGVFTITAGNPNTYSVSKNNHSVFAESNYRFMQGLSANIGFRMDFVNLDIEYDVPGQRGQNSIKSPRYLPSLNLKYDVNGKNALRLGASKTYTLPQSKEISPFQYVNISFASEGNPNLLLSDNYNVDFRWDNYLSSSELISGTVFYKRIIHPIGRVDKGNSAGLLTYENISDAANVMGLEVEFRKNIFSLKNDEAGSENKLYFGANASYILTSADLKLTNTPERNSELEGASPFLLNLDLTHHYSKSRKDWVISIVFNYFSDRIYTIGTIGYRDIMEEGVATLNLISNYKFSNRLGLNLKIANLLASPIELTRKISGSNQKITLNKFNRGVDFSFGLSLEL